MLKKIKENLRLLLRKFVWWQPILFILLMFAIGVYTNHQNKSDESSYSEPVTVVATSGAESLANESAAMESVSEGSVSGDSAAEDSVSEESVSEDNASEGSASESSAAEGSISESGVSTESSAIISNGKSDGEVPSEESTSAPKSVSSGDVTVRENGTYTSKEEVALYIHTYKKLPSNYITKAEAKERGWNPHSGNLSKVLKGMSIGGDYFGNREGILPQKDGRKYYECDIDYISDYRNEKRIVYSNDGLIFYTEDHYETFEQLY